MSADKFQTLRDGKQSLSLLTFFGLLCPSKCDELLRIRITDPFPLRRAQSDLDEPQLAQPSELPYAEPSNAEAWQRKKSLEAYGWKFVCDAVIAGNWNCQARREGQIMFEDLPGEVLLRAFPNFGDETLLLFGERFEDVKFSRRDPTPFETTAVDFIRDFCRTRDPKAHSVRDIQAAIHESLGFDVSDGQVRRFMGMAGVDKAWSARGRRAAKPKSS